MRKFTGENRIRKHVGVEGHVYYYSVGYKEGAVRL